MSVVNPRVLSVIPGLPVGYCMIFARTQIATLEQLEWSASRFSCKLAPHRDCSFLRLRYFAVWSLLFSRTLSMRTTAPSRRSSVPS